jgi:antitoxin MazE
MRVAKWGNSLAVRLPADVVRSLGLSEGDEVKITVRSERELQLERDRERERAWEELRALARKVEFPSEWKFDREEIYEERMRDLGW